MLKMHIQKRFHFENSVLIVFVIVYAVSKFMFDTFEKYEKKYGNKWYVNNLMRNLKYLKDF